MYAIRSYYDVVYRLGFANSRRGARQFVGHGHVLVNGKKVDIPSFNVREGDVVSVKEDPKARRLATRNLELTQITPAPDWMTIDRDNHSGVVITSYSIHYTKLYEYQDMFSLFVLKA